MPLKDSDSCQGVLNQFTLQQASEAQYCVPLSPNLIAPVPLAIWIYLFFLRGNFWQLHEDKTEAKPPNCWPRVVAIVPARNEAETIARAVTSLAQQDYPGAFSIVIVDDHSTDGTADLARKTAEECGATARTVVLFASELPPGWTGKVWAINEGVRAASDRAPDFFWFTDADIVHEPDTLRGLVSRTETDSLDLTSLMVLLHARTFPERLLIPPFLYFFLLLYPPQWIADPRARTAGAAGGCILLRRAALERINGMQTICSEVIDDCALARAVKKSGGKIWMGLTRASVSLRSYGSFSEIRDLIARAAFTQLDYSFFLLLATLAGLFVTYLLPWVLFFAYPGEAWWFVDTTIAMMAASLMSSARSAPLKPWVSWAITERSTDSSSFLPFACT